MRARHYLVAVAGRLGPSVAIAFDGWQIGFDGQYTNYSRSLAPMSPAQTARHAVQPAQDLREEPSRIFKMPSSRLTTMPPAIPRARRDAQAAMPTH